MLLRFDSLLVRALMRVPLWMSPYLIESARVGMDTRTYVKVRWR